MRMTSRNGLQLLTIDTKTLVLAWTNTGKEISTNNESCILLTKRFFDDFEVA